jgi:uncharacterized protein
VLARDGYPPGAPCWVDVAEPDPAAAARFYGELFGWDLDDRMPPDAPGSYFMATLDGRQVAAVGSQAAEGAPAAWQTYVWVENADDAATMVEAAGGSVLVPPFDVVDAGRMAVCADPAGAPFSLWHARNHRGAQAVNEPGTWNWSVLHAPDPDAAARFYGDVFGWETLSGIGDAALVRLPGYGDFLERTADPDIRKRQAEVGAPPGFEDAIAWIAAGDAPHWSVTFSVADADAAAATVESLGGEVVLAPHDTGWSRDATVRDPQGATLTLSQFTPPG